jgi:hypothetical protein
VTFFCLFGELQLLRQTIVVGDLATFPEEASQSATSMKDVLER